MSVAQITYNLESASKAYREAYDLLALMKQGGVRVDLAISHTYVGQNLQEGEEADLNALALGYLERRFQEARDRLVNLGLKPEALEIAL